MQKKKRINKETSKVLEICLIVEMLWVDTMWMEGSEEDAHHELVDMLHGR